MKDLELRSYIIERANEIYRELGAHDAADAFRIAADFLEKLAAVLRRFDTQQKFDSMLDELPEPNKAEKVGLRGVFRFGPQLVRYGINRLAKEISVELPKPPRGRDQDFVPREQIDICRFISEKYAEGIALHIAKKRAAAHFNTSARTIERIWAARKNKRPADPTFRDALRLLKD